MAGPKLTHFVDTDQFLRRVRFPDHFKRDMLFWRAFKDKDVRMSWTYRDARLMNDDGLDAYHAYFSDDLTPTPMILNTGIFIVRRVRHATKLTWNS